MRVSFFYQLYILEKIDRIGYTEPMFGITSACGRNAIKGWVVEAHNRSQLTVQGCKFSAFSLLYSLFLDEYYIIRKTHALEN